MELSITRFGGPLERLLDFFDSQKLSDVEISPYMSCRNLKMTLEYDGTHFSGWQTQPQKRTVQETIEKILSRVTQEKIHVIGASRTDAGVHALGQIANFKTRSLLSTGRFLLALNGLLPEDIAIKKIQEVPLDFHSNRQALQKTYRYLILNSKIRSALLKDRVWHVWTPLNLKKMRQAARFLVGRHDFSAFRGTRSDTKTSVRTIFRIKIRKDYAIEITGNGFLKYMVRNIVGTLVEVGRGKILPEEMKRILRSKDRRNAAMTAPACGLTLVKVCHRDPGP